MLHAKHPTCQAPDGPARNGNIRSNPQDNSGPPYLASQGPDNPAFDMFSKRTRGVTIGVTSIPTVHRPRLETLRVLNEKDAQERFANHGTLAMSGQTLDAGRFARKTRWGSLRQFARPGCPAHLSGAAQHPHARGARRATAAPAETGGSRRRPVRRGRSPQAGPEPPAFWAVLSCGGLEVLAIGLFVAIIGLTWSRSGKRLAHYDLYIAAALGWFFMQAAYDVIYQGATLTTFDTALVSLVNTWQAPMRDFEIHGFALLMILAAR